LVFLWNVVHVSLLRFVSSLWFANAKNIFLVAFYYLQAAINDSSDPDVDAYMIVYSCADRHSFRSASSALRRFKEMLSGRSVPIMIVANKVDLARKRQVSSDGKNIFNQALWICVALFEKICCLHFKDQNKHAQLIYVVTLY